MSNIDSKKEDLKCPDAPKITIRPIKKKIPYINTIRDDDSSSDEQYEKPTIKLKENIKEKEKDMDDRYYDDEDSFEDEKETKSESGNNKGFKGFRKFKEDNPESIS